jgi:glucokinase
MPLLGIDIGGTSVKAGLVEPDGKIIFKTAVDISELRKGNLIKNFLAWLQPVIEKNNIGQAGVGVPGFVSKNEDRLIEITNVREIEGTAFINTLKTNFPKTSFKFSNDANAAAYGVYNFCKEIKTKTFGYITLGTGLGSAVIQDGKIFTGANGNGPELGMMYLFGNKTAEQLVSKDGIIDLAEQSYCQYSGKTKLDLQNITTKTLFNTAAENDLLALKTFETAGTLLGQIITIFVQLFDISTIYVGGGISPCLKFMKKSILEYLSEKLTDYHYKSFSIEEASLGNDAGILGAAALCI